MCHDADYAQAVRKPRVSRIGVGSLRHSQLFEMPEPLKCSSVNHPPFDFIEVDVAVDGIDDQLIDCAFSVGEMPWCCNSSRASRISSSEKNFWFRWRISRNPATSLSRPS